MPFDNSIIAEVGMAPADRTNPRVAACWVQRLCCGSGNSRWYPMPADRRRHAAALAAYLAQLALSSDDGSGGNDTRYAGLSVEDLDQRRRDYQQALLWARAADFSEEDIRSLDVMRRRYSFRFS